jgi:hypothetical protein
MGVGDDREYRADVALAAEEWLALDDTTRLTMVEEAHERHRWSVGENARVHAAMHVIVENRLAQKDEPVVTAYDRLRAAGVDRHESIHALASVVAAQLFDALAEKRELSPEDDAAFATLDPADWLGTPAPRREHVARPHHGRRPKKRKR